MAPEEPDPRNYKMGSLQPGSQINPNQPLPGANLGSSPPGAGNLPSQNGDPGPPSYDDHWSDWINPSSLIDWFTARYASNGDKYGYMLGSTANNR